MGPVRLSLEGASYLAEPWVSNNQINYESVDVFPNDASDDDGRIAEVLEFVDLVVMVVTHLVAIIKLLQKITNFRNE